MKIEYLIDFLPSDMRRRTVLRVSRRRSALLLSLMIALVTGVAAHSWNRYRQADIDRTISMQVCTNSIKVDDVVDALAREQQAITSFLGVYDHIALPLNCSDLVATVTHLMPEKMSLAMLRLEVQQEKSNPAESKDTAKSGKGPKAKPAKDAKPEKVTAPKRWIIGTIRGYAASNEEVFDFERRLNRTKPLTAVTVSANEPTEVPGGRVQTFAINFRIPLDARYQLSVPAPIAAVPTGHREADQ